MKQTGSYFSLIILSVSLLFMACTDDALNDYRGNFTGSYSGNQTYTYYILDPVDTSKTDDGYFSANADIGVHPGSCQNCIAIVYDTLLFDNQIFHSPDTIAIEESGNYTAQFEKIGDKYFRYYALIFDRDSLHIMFEWGEYQQSFTYTFDGRRTSLNR